MHLPGCQKSGAFHIRIKKNQVSHILFVEKRGANHIPGSAEIGVHLARISVLCHIYEPAPPPTSCKLSYNIFHSFNPVLLVKNDFVSI